MNDILEPTIKVEARPSVAEFVEQVRARLSDLSEEEREELVGGLEADLSELVAERGKDQSGDDLLGDPVRYADELRAAAGFGPSPKKERRTRQPARETITSWLDDAHEKWDRLMEHPRVAPVWEGVAAMRPAWWVLRGWLAVQVLDISTGPWEATTLIPTLYGAVPGGLLLLAAIAVSVQIGRKQLWPGSAVSSSVLARVLVLGVNAAVIAAIPNVVGDEFPTYGGQEIFRQMGRPYRPEPGLMNGSRYVHNVFAYDALGNPIMGVQLFDQRGRPLNVNREYATTYRRRGNEVAYPWLNGSQGLYNVFPLPSRQQRAFGQVESAWESENPPVLPAPPLAVVPPVSLPAQPEAEADAEPDSADGQGGSADSEKPGSR